MSVIKTNCFTIIIFFTVLSLSGLAILPKLPIQLKPEYNYQTIGVSFSYPGASPRTIEEKVTSVIEARLALLREVKNVRSVSGNGFGRVTADIDEKADINLASHEVSQIISNIYPLLPNGLSYPNVYIWGNSPGESPVLTYSVLTDKNDEGLATIIEDYVIEPLQQVKGLGEVQLHGIAPFRWNIIVDYNKMLNLGIPNSDVYYALRLEQVQIPLGQAPVNSNADKQVVIKGMYGGSPEELKKIPVHTGKEGHITYLEDIANIKREAVPLSRYYRLNGKNTAFVVIYPEGGQNQLKVAKRAKQKAAEINKNLPGGINLVLLNDNTEYISGEIKKIIRRSSLTLLLLLLFTGLISFNLRYMLVISLSLLCNLAINFFIYYLLGVQLHLYSFAGITVSLGLLIDNSIVMTDHIRHKKNNNVFLAVFASTLTSIASLSVIFFLDKNAQLNLLDFAVVLIVNLSVSLFIALFFIPALIEKIPVYPKVKNGTYFRRKKRILPVNRLYTRLVFFFGRFKWIWITVLILSFGLPVFLLPGKIEKENFWANMYNKTFGSEVYTRSIGPVVEKIIGGTLRVFVEKVDHGKFYSEKQRTSVVMYASMEEGATLEQMNEVFIEIENFLKQFPEIDRFESNIYGPDNARMVITFKPEHEFTGFPFYLQNELITKAIGFSSLDSRIYGMGDGFNNSMQERVGNYKVEFTGYNYEQVYRYADGFRKELLRNPRIKEANIMGSDGYFRDKSWEYVLEADRGKIAFKNTAYSGLSNFLNLVTTSDRYMGTINNNSLIEQLVISSGAAGNFDYWQLQNAVFPSNKTLLKPGVITDISKQKTSTEINKKNQQYVIFVEWDFIGTYQLGRMVLDELLTEYTKILPMGYKIENKQWVYRSSKEKKQQTALIFLVVLIVYLISAVLFESLWQPLAVISLVPVTFVGVFLAFRIFGVSFDQGGYSALILLCGLTVNSAIYIINELNNVKKDRVDSGNRAYFMAYRSKIVPILLTILSTLMGMLPFLIAGQKEDFWFPLAMATCSGLLFSIIGILFVLPLFFVRSKTK